MVESDLRSIDPATFGLDEGNIFKGACVPHHQQFRWWNFELEADDRKRDEDSNSFSYWKNTCYTREDKGDREGILHTRPIP